MSLPPEEQVHWQRELDAQEKAREEEEKRLQVPEQSPADRALHLQLCTESARMRDSLPGLWGILQSMTRPDARTGPKLMSPGMSLTSGESMAYMLGQDSIGQWLLALSEDELEDGHE